MNCHDFLIEVGTEEIPARMLARGAQDLENLLIGALDSAGLEHDGSARYFTPRRIAVHITGIPEAQADRSETAPGPSIAIARDADGEFTKAAVGFARGKGCSVDDLIEADGPRGPVVALRIETPGRRTNDVLSDAVPACLGRLKFPKAMRWADGRGPFVRPVHWICCLLGDDIVNFEFLNIVSGNESRGHRFMSGDSFRVDAPSSYVTQLRDRHVTADSAERVRMIREQMDSVQKETGLIFIKNDSLFDEVSNIVENPILITCNFDEDFLRLPVEVLTTAMASHQRYFAMRDPARGNALARTFGVVCNNQAKDMTVVGRGNERVLAARLYDCSFFWVNDLETGLEKMLERLGERLFLKNAGTMYDKVLRVRFICEKTADAAGLSAAEKASLLRAATLCKADLMSSVVNELPEVQGIMGSYYAAAAGESRDVCDAIRDHYLPRHAGDDLPASDISALLVVADRIDSIATCFHVGAVPTGSRDPLALRRAAIAVLRIVSSSERLRDLTVPQLLEIAAGAHALMSDSSSFMTAPVSAGSGRKAPVSVEDFMTERFRGILADEYGASGDVSNAVLPFLTGEGAVPPAELGGRVSAIGEALADDTFRNFLDNVFKRVGNMLRKADVEIPEWRSVAKEQSDPDRDYNGLFSLELESDLETCRVNGMGELARARAARDYAAVLGVMASFDKPLARFIGTGKDGVPVLLEKDEDKRLGRLALLDRIYGQFNWFADFSKISTR